MKKTNDKRSGKGCWYKIFLFECPVCGRDEEYRERRFTPKPDSQDRYEYIESYDGCLG